MIYEINSNTLAICFSNSETIVYENDNSYKFNCKCEEIIEENCLYYGSSYRGRVESSRSMLCSSYKCPIILEESREIIYFPIKSEKNNTNNWINYKMVKKYYKLNKKVEIEFVNGMKIIVNNSYESVNNQILKSSRLESIIRYRKSVNFL